MSESSIRGKSYELKIQKFTERKLQLEIRRDSRSGAGWVHKGDIRDRYGELPLSVEIKDQETLKLKEWWRDANDKASVGQAPIVVFPMDSEDLAIMRYGDLLDFIKEMFDYRAEAEDLRISPPLVQHVTRSHSMANSDQEGRPIALRPSNRCREGHIASMEGYCLQKGCKYSRGYKKPKEKK